MRHLVLVDAYNAMYRLLERIPEDRDEARRGLVRRAAEVLRLGVHGGIERVHLVFDTLAGAERAGLRSRDGDVSWHYAHGSADEEILDHLRRHEARSGGVVVVSDDRELLGRARQLGARAMSVDRFFSVPPHAPRAEERRRGALGPPFTAADFGLPEGDIDLLDPDDDLG